MLLLCLRQPMNIVSQLQNLCRLRGECSCEMFLQVFHRLLLLCKALCNALLVLVQVQDSVRLRRLLQAAQALSDAAQHAGELAIYRHVAKSNAEV